MAFKHEELRDNAKDQAFIASMGLLRMNGLLDEVESPNGDWFTDRENNAFLIFTGSSRDMPEFYVLWWNGEKIFIEAWDGGSTGNGTDGYHIRWDITKVKIPIALWDQQDVIMALVESAFSAKNHHGKKKLNSMTVTFDCKPERI